MWRAWCQNDGGIEEWASIVRIILLMVLILHSAFPFSEDVWRQEKRKTRPWSVQYFLKISLLYSPPLSHCNVLTFYKNWVWMSWVSDLNVSNIWDLLLIRKVHKKFVKSSKNKTWYLWPAGPKIGDVHKSLCKISKGIKVVVWESKNGILIWLPKTEKSQTTEELKSSQHMNLFLRR